MPIRNKKITQVRLDDKTFDANNTNRALDNIINTVNPWVDEATQTINRLESEIDDLSLTAGVEIIPQGASPIAGTPLTFSGSGGLSFSSNGSDTLVINQRQVTVAAQGTAGTGTGNDLAFSGSGGATVTRSGTTITINQGAPPSTTITFDVSGSNTLSGSSFQLSGANGIVLTGSAPNTLIIDASGIPPTGPAGGVLGYAGSTYPNPNGLAGTGSDASWSYIRVRQGNYLGNPVGVKLKYDTFDQSSAGGRVLQIEGADAYSFPNPLGGGDIVVQGGKGNTQPVVNNGAGGGAFLYGGDGVNAVGGEARVQGGYSNAAAGGDAYLVGGSPAAGNNGGDVYVIGGSNQFQNATGGDVTIRGGDGVTDGVVNIGLTTTSKVNIGAASIPTEVYGSLTGSVISASSNIIAPAITGSQITSSNFIGWGNRIVRPYLAACDLTTQTASATTAAYPMRFNTLEESNNISIVSGSRITFAYDGVYNIQFSAQINKASGGSAEIDIWLGESGSNVPRSNTNIHVRGNNVNEVAAWNFVRTFPSGSYAEIFWRTNDTDVVLLYENSSSSPTRPEIPSVIVSVSQV